jgi:hypothetical protein
MLSVVFTRSDRIQKLLESARQKLVTADIPQMLRITAFLRISCLTLDEPGAYFNLMQKLCSHKEWWMTCKVTAAETLTSSNPEINLLLEPINLLHQPQTVMSTSSTRKAA